MGSNLLLNSLRSRLGAKFNLMDSASGRQSREAVRQKKEEPGTGRDGWLIYTGPKWRDRGVTRVGWL